jgi:hypothetical protein
MFDSTSATTRHMASDARKVFVAWLRDNCVMHVVHAIDLSVLHGMHEALAQGALAGIPTSLAI